MQPSVTETIFSHPHTLCVIYRVLLIIITISKCVYVCVSVFEIVFTYLKTRST